MFCPNYTNAEVFNAFNEVIEALGGKPMTAEEFSNKELRMQRTGADLIAARVAYRVWNRNNGNPIDEAPNGLKSILFLSLLDHFGDRLKAIIAKTNVYSDEFFNWFGDWVKAATWKLTPDSFVKNILSRENLSNTTYPESKVHNSVIHVSKAKIDNFNSKSINTNAPDTELGFFFSGDYSTITQLREGKHYAGVKDVLGHNVHIVDINLKNPILVYSYISKLPIELGYVSEDELLRMSSEQKHELYRKIRRDLENKGYDGIQYVLGYETDEDGFGSTTPGYIVFDANNISVKNIIDDSNYTTFTPNNVNSVSKVVDSNGEPLVVYHNTNTDDVYDFSKYEKRSIGHYFSPNRPWESRGKNKITAYLNIKNPENTSVEVTMALGYDALWIDKKKSSQYDGEFGFIDDNNIGEIIAFEPNQIKHVENLGTWNPGTTNIYNAPKITEIADPLQAMSLTDTFSGDVLQSLLNGDTVSSQDLVSIAMTSGNIFTGSNFDLAQVLARHDVPVRLSDYDLGFGIAATTITEEGGGAVVILNRDWVNKITKQYFGEVLLHEIIHAITSQALSKPKTPAERVLKNKATVVFNLLNKAIKLLGGNRFGDIGKYGLTSVEEFVSVFATDFDARRQYYAIAREVDRKVDNTFFGKFRDFVNALSRVFVNRNIIRSAEEKLSDYETYFNNYLNNTPTIRKGNLKEGSVLRSVYNSVDKTLLENEAITELLINTTRRLEAFKKDNFELSVSFKDMKLDKDLPNSTSMDIIISSIRSRINALKNSNLPESVKQQLLLSALTQLGMFENPEVSRYEALAYLLDSIKTPIVDALEEIRQIKSQETLTANNSNYQFHQHQNIGWFSVLLKNISDIFTNETEVQRLISGHNKKQSKENKINAQIIEDLNNYIKELSQFVSDANGILEKVLDRAAVTDLQKVVSEVGSIEGAELVELMRKSGYVLQSDVSWMEMMFGQADAATSEIIRAAAHIIQKTDDKVSERLINKGDLLLNLQKNLKKGESLKDLYEMVDGKATQYLVRKINFGKFEQDYRKFLADLNKRYGLADNDVAGPTDETKRIAWELEKNEWLNKHCHRKYTAKYYNAWAKVPMHVKSKLDKINGSISAILDKYHVVDENGYYHYDRVTDEEDWKTLQHLWHAKKEMRNPYTVNGEEKQGEEKAVADVLNNLYKELYGDTYKERTKNINKWKQARRSVIDLCGGQEEYEKYLKGEKNKFDANKLDKWDQRNSRYQFKKDANGDAIVFKQIEREMQGFKFNYGEEYDKLKEKVNDLLRPAYDLAGQVNPDFLSSKVKAELGDLYHDMATIRRLVIASHPGYKQMSQRYKSILDEYIKYVDTRYLQQIKKVTWENIAYVGEGTMLDFDESLFAMAMYEWGDVWESDGFFSFRPYQYLKSSVAKNEDFMEWVPNDAWAEQEEDDRYVNEEFDSSFGESRVPFLHLYDNSAAWNKILNSETLKALYLGVVEAIDEANSMQTNRVWTNKYRLPGVSMLLYERLKRNSFFRWWKVLLDWAKEKIGMVNDLEEDIRLRDLTTSNDDNTSEGEEIHSLETHIVGVQPDGSRYMALPQYYTRRMKNPENISYELLDIVLSYYKMSLNYLERLKVRDTLETLADYVRKHSESSTEKSNILGRIRKTANKDEVSNLYRLMRNLLDMGLYNKVRTEYKLGKFKLSATFSTIQLYTTAVNLGHNKKVAAVGFMTAMFNHILNAAVGKEYNLNSLTFAMKEAAIHVVKLFATKKTYSKLPNDKMLVILKTFNIANLLERNYENTGQGTLLRIWLQNHTFGYLATVDYLTKSLITIACLKDYRLIDGEFYSRYDIKMLLHDQQRYKKLLSKYKNAKSAYDLLQVKDGKLVIAEQAAEAWSTNKDRIMAKCRKLSEKADGVCTGLQRAAVQRSWIGMLLMVHRQYLPLMLHERWGKRIYDYDTQEYTHGQFRLLYQYLTELATNTWLPGVVGGALTGYWFGSFVGAGIGIGAATGYRLYGLKHGKNKSFKQINEEFFKRYNDQKETIRSVENLYAMKQILIENLLYNLMRYLVVNPICALADDDKDDWFLQSIAYWLKATLFEISVAYNFSDLSSNIKSPTAATVLLDRVTYFADNIWDLMKSIGYLLSITDEEPKIIGKNSPYEGWYRWQKALFQLGTAGWQNEFEHNTAKGVRFKHGYLDNQILSESELDQYNIFDAFE